METSGVEHSPPRVSANVVSQIRGWGKGLRARLNMTLVYTNHYYSLALAGSCHATAMTHVVGDGEKL